MSEDMNHKWNPKDEKCRKCLSVEDYQKGKIPLCEIEKICVYSEGYRDRERRMA